LRDICPQVARFGNQPVRGAISRVDEAFAAFYRRTREGQTPGYPRFKSRRRFRTVLYDEPVNWALRGLGTSPAKGRNGSRPALYVQGVGEIAQSGTRHSWTPLGDAEATADSCARQAPFHSGFPIEDYQLDPVVRALSMLDSRLGFAT